jgi:hypothetical protein
MKDMPEPTDEALLDLARRSETAFMLLFERHREVIFREAYRLTNSAAAAEDIAQECFLGLLDAPGRFDPAKARCERISMALSEILPGNIMDCGKGTLTSRTRRSTEPPKRPKFSCNRNDRR